MVATRCWTRATTSVATSAQVGRLSVRSLIRLIILIVLIDSSELAQPMREREVDKERERKMVGEIYVGGGKKERGENSRNAQSAEHCSRGTKTLLFADTVINPGNSNITSLSVYDTYADRCSRAVLIIISY